MVAVQLVALFLVPLFHHTTGFLPLFVDLKQKSSAIQRTILQQPGKLHAEPETTQSSSLSLSSTNDHKDDDDQRLVTVVREAVVLAGGETAWEESMQCLVVAISLEQDEFTTTVAEACLADAYGWKAWAKASDKMKKFHRPKVPDPEKLKDALAWLREGPLGLNDEQVKASILKSPKTFLDAPLESFRKALGTAPRKYRDNLVELIRLDPSVLEVTYNCDGEGCASECGRCWVSYENRLKA